MAADTHNNDLEVDDPDRDEEEDEVVDHSGEIIGIDSPTIDLRVVGVSKKLALLLGAEGTRDLIVGPLFRGISRKLHPDVSDGKDKTNKAYSVISSTVTEIRNLSEEVWAETYRKFTTSRSGAINELRDTKSRLEAEKALIAEKEIALTLALETIETLQKINSPMVLSDAVRGLFLSGVSRPSSKLDDHGDNVVSVTELRNCMVVCGNTVHYIAGDGQVKSSTIDPGAERGHQIPRIEAQKYADAREDSIFFSNQAVPKLPRRVLGDYSGAKVWKVNSDEGAVVKTENFPEILADISSEIAVQSNVMIVSPAINNNKIVGIKVENGGMVSDIYGPYNVTKARVTGPHI